MIDFVKVEIPKKYRPSLLENPNLEWSQPLVRRTGEILPICEAQLGEMSLVIKGNFILLSGSIHKYYKEGFNYSDFRFSDLVSTLNRLSSIMQIDPQECPLRNLEYGVNIGPPIPTKSFIRQLIGHKNVLFSSMDGKGGNSLGKVAKHQRYWIKCYDKSRQYGLDSSLLRVEVKVKKMVHLESHSIRHLSDLSEPTKLLHLQDDLLTRIDELIVVDKTVDEEYLSNRQIRLLNEWSNPSYIEELQVINRKKFERERRKIRTIQETHSKTPLRSEIKRLVSQKWEELIRIDQIKNTELTRVVSPEGGVLLDQINPSSSRLIPSPRLCKITGEDISDQKKGSRFLSAKKIGYYPAHNLRNQDSNPRNNLRRRIQRIKRQGPTLFPMTEMIKLSGDQIEMLKFWKGTSFDELFKGP